MIEHAWTVICDRSVIDQDTGNISLDTIEQLNLTSPLKDGIYVIPFRLDIVSLWYRLDEKQPETAEAHILRNLMVAGSGVHHFVVSLAQEGRSSQVARVPFEIALQRKVEETI